MKLNVSKRAEKPATNYFNAQVGICVLWTLSAILMSIFGFIMHSKIKDVMTANAGNVETVPTEYAGVQGYSDRMWITGLSQLASACCIGTAMIALAKYLLESANGGCMKFCGIFDGICGVLGCCEGVGLCISFFLILAMYSAMSDAAKVCAPVASALTTTAPLAAGAASPDCMKFITGIRPAIGLFACMICCMATLSLKIAGLLCFSAKNAMDVSQIFDQEEDGPAYDDYELGDNAY